MNLVEGLLAQIDRCNVIRENCLEIGDAGAFLSAMLGMSLANARQALASGDVVAMVEAVKDLEDYSE